MKKVILGSLLVCAAAAVQGQNWLLTGNAPAAGNFLGTTTNTDLVFKRANAPAGLIGANVTSFGVGALNVASTGTNNSAFGINTLNLNTTGSENTAVGYWALAVNTTGNNNVATGFRALYSNTSGSSNTAYGSTALYTNTTGSLNTAIGPDALNLNTTGDGNTAVGYISLNNNSNGRYNCAFGVQALSINTSGNYNTAAGYGAVYKNTTGASNTGIGHFAMFYNTTGSFNTAVGENALINNTIGTYNTAIGYQAGPASVWYTNTSAIGNGATPTASNEVMLGNTSLTAVKAAGGFVIWSDGRFKNNIKENVPGLEFINQLKPVTYNYKIHELNSFIGVNENTDASAKTGAAINETAIAEKEKMVYSGFVAQEVEKAAIKLGYDFSGVYKPKNDSDPYGLDYAGFVVPLVKAVQELSAENKQLKDQLKSLEEKVNKILNNSGTTHLELDSKSIVLDQNAPNPFAESTTINFSIDTDFSTAVISITDSKGTVIKTQSVTAKGKSQLTVYGSNLSSGTYQYSLIVDGKVISTKSFVKQ